MVYLEVKTETVLYVYISQGQGQLFTVYLSPFTFEEERWTLQPLLVQPVQLKRTDLMLPKAATWHLCYWL